MKFHFFLIGILMSGIVAAQNQKYGPTNDSLYLGFYRDSCAMIDRPTLVIVPFHPKKYMSEIDQDIAKGTDYTYQHTRGFFRKGLDNCLLIASKEWNDYVSMHADEGTVNKDLNFIYRTVGTSVVPYEPPVLQSDKNLKKRLADYWVKLQTNVTTLPEPGTRIENGQLVSVPDNRELITKAKIYNTLVFDSLNPKYHGDYYLFVNELDLLNAAPSQQAYESDNFNRVIKVHYSVYDKEGNELFSLVKKQYFKSTQNDLPSILKDEFLPLGYEVIYALDSYRFLKAGLTPLTEQEVELAKNRKGRKLPALSKLK